MIGVEMTRDEIRVAELITFDIADLIETDRKRFQTSLPALCEGSDQHGAV
jgi:hypothetical protein